MASVAAIEPIFLAPSALIWMMWKYIFHLSSVSSSYARNASMAMWPWVLPTSRIISAMPRSPSASPGYFSLDALTLIVSRESLESAMPTTPYLGASNMSGDLRLRLAVGVGLDFDLGFGNG